MFYIRCFVVSILSEIRIHRGPSRGQQRGQNPQPIKLSKTIFSICPVFLFHLLYIHFGEQRNLFRSSNLSQLDQLLRLAGLPAQYHRPFFFFNPAALVSFGPDASWTQEDWQGHGEPGRILVLRSSSVSAHGETKHAAQQPE